MAIREELELDISSALARIEEVGAALTAITEQFRASLADAVSSIADSIPQITIPAVFDVTSDIGSVVAEGLEENNGTDLGLNLNVDDANTDPFTDALQESAAQPLDLAPLNLEGQLVNGEQLSLEFDEAASGNGETLLFDAELEPSIDLETVRSSITELATEQSEIAFEATLDPSELQAGYEAFANEVAQPLEVPVGITDEPAQELDKTAESAKNVREELDDTAVFAGGAFLAKVTAAFAAVAATAAGLFTAAVTADSALIAFNRSLGDLAPSIAQIDVNGLNIDLAQLAQNLGSSDEEVLGVAQRFGQLGLTSGAAAEDIATANNQLFAVAGNIRAVNPALGNLDQIATRAGQAFIRGGRSAAALGLSLTQQEIRARAAERANKDINDTFTQFELFAAGASLASEQFGDSIKENIEAASENPTIALERLKQVFGDTLEDFGKPLVVPVLKLLDDLVPTALGFVNILADISTGFLPIVQAFFDAVQPLLDYVSRTINDLVKTITPTFQAIGRATASLTASFDPLVRVTLGLAAALVEGLAFAVTPVAEAFAAIAESGFGKVLPFFLLLNVAAAKFIGVGLITALTGILTLLTPLPGVLGAVGAAVTSLQSITLPWVLAITAAVAAIGFLIAKARETPPVFDDVIQSTLNTALAVADVETAVVRYTGALDKYVTESQILKNEDLVTALSETGLSVEQFTDFVQGGTEGLRDFVTFLAGNTEGGLRDYRTGIRITAEQVANLTDEQVKALFANRDTRGANNVLGDTYSDLAGSIATTGEAAFNLIVAQQGLTQEQRDAAIESARAANGEIDYAKALTEATAAITRQETAENRRKVASGEAAQELQALSADLTSYRQQLALGVSATEILSQATVTFGDDAEAAQQFIDQITQEVKEFTDTVVGNVPSVIQTFADLSREEGGSFAEISDSLQKNLADTENWSSTLIRLSEENKTSILQVAAEIGPERTAILLEAYGGDEQKLEEHLARMLEIETRARVDAEVAAKIGFARLSGAQIADYEALEEELRKQAFWGPITREEFDNAVQAVKDKYPEFENEALNAGERGRRGFNQGFRGLGAFDDSDNPLSTQIENQGEQAQEAATEQGSAAGEAYIQSAGTTVAENGGVLAANLATGLANASNATEFFARLVGVFAGARIISGLNDTIVSNTLSLAQTINGVLLNVITETSFGSQFVGFSIASGIGRGAFDNRAFIGDELVRGFTYVVENYSDEADMTGWYLGDALAEGLKRGLRDNASSVADVAAQIIRDAEQAARDEAQTESPSKVWEGIGRDLVNGLARGLERAAPVSDRAAANVIGNAANVGAAGGNVSNISVTVPVTINGNADPAMGAQIGRAAAVELRRVLQLEARMA